MMLKAVGNAWNAARPALWVPNATERHCDKTGLRHALMQQLMQQLWPCGFRFPDLYTA